ncbi:hypothetical protein AGMMS50284_5950 [Clostridia bacterium]|nr:hypothetical protein AGMMS50284_5950 [Clostridia bacterium]
MKKLFLVIIMVILALLSSCQNEERNAPKATETPVEIHTRAATEDPTVAETIDQQTSPEKWGREGQVPTDQEMVIIKKNIKLFTEELSKVNAPISEYQINVFVDKLFCVGAKEIKKLKYTSYIEKVYEILIEDEKGDVYALTGDRWGLGEIQKDGEILYEVTANYAYMKPME